MKHYLLVWEVNDLDWKIVEKGNRYMIVYDGQTLVGSLLDFSESMAKSRNIREEQFIITYCQALD